MRLFDGPDGAVVGSVSGWTDDATAVDSGAADDAASDDVATDPAGEVTVGRDALVLWRLLDVIVLDFDGDGLAEVCAVRSIATSAEEC